MKVTSKRWAEMGDGEKNEVIAMALGWRESRDCPGRWVRRPWLPGDVQAYHRRPRPYVTGGDESPWENWGLLAEMLRLFHERTRNSHFPIQIRINCGTTFNVCHPAGTLSESGGTLHRALAAALVAAELVEEATCPPSPAAAAGE